MSKYDCVTCETKNCFVKLCNDKWIDYISKSKQTCTYLKGHHLINEGDDVLGLYFIHQGKVKVYSTGISDKKQVVRLTKSGDIIGHRGYGGELYPIGACALEDSVVCFINNDSIYKAFMYNPTLTFELMMYYSKELRNLESKIKKLAQMNVKEKVIDAILYSKRIYEKNDLGFVSITLDRNDLADLAGINTEQLSRSLSLLKKDNTISLMRNQIIIKDEKRLYKMLTPFESKAK